MAEGEHVDPASPGARGGLSSLFENYLKMSRFNLTETELLNKCLIQKNVTPSVPLLAEHSVLSDELLLINGDITEVDEEKLLQDLDGDSDFSETVSEFSSLSLTNSKLKCRRRDRWVRARQKKESISKTPLIHKFRIKIWLTTRL
ncbi:hypothetical protein EB796_024591 [Bugula neritina]|uniref:Uncharacterized protein n=1 Tax=Bugula neritina TaxID=10212 RepID=A0A7J7IT50_BUGNE|nr:hypothetical protein EB796_024591 [Bugula neritina]